MRQHHLWPRCRTDSVFHVVSLRIQEHLEELLAPFGMIGESSVREAKPDVPITIAHGIHDPATIQGPEPEMADENGHDGSCHRQRVSRKQFHPPDVELLPGLEGASCALEIRFAVSNCDDLLVEVPTYRPGLDDSNGTVRERQSSRASDETGDHFVCGTGGKKH